MPSFRHGRKTAILWGNANLSAYLNDASTSNQIDTPETTTFGTDFKTYMTGIESAQISMGGLYEGSVSDPTLQTALANGTDQVLTIATEGLTSPLATFVGYRASLAQILESNYEIKSAVADVVSVSVTAEADGGLDSGFVLAGATDVTGAVTLNNNALDFGNGITVPTTNGYSAHLHVTANTQTSTTVIKVQHSANNSTWADLVTFTTTSATTTTSERKTSTSASVNRYVRAQAVSAGATGTLTYSLAFSRRA